MLRSIVHVVAQLRGDFDEMMKWVLLIVFMLVHYRIIVMLELEQYISVSTCTCCVVIPKLALISTSIATW